MEVNNLWKLNKFYFNDFLPNIKIEGLCNILNFKLSENVEHFDFLYKMHL